jgi:peptide-methionine (R)-S-oxide reductase
MVKLILILAGIVGVGAYTLSQNPTAVDRPAKEQTVSSNANPAAAVDPDAPGADPDKIDWSQVDWAKRLTPHEFEIMRNAGTEYAGTGEYSDFFEEGRYNCRGCGLPLFKSDAKFDAHCGWPSFDEVVDKDAVVEIDDYSYGGIRRIEVRCRRCNAHLGHVFDDGPTKTGLRYCMNSASIRFQPEKDAEAAGEETVKKP